MFSLIKAVVERIPNPALFFAAVIVSWFVVPPVSLLCQEDPVCGSECAPHLAGVPS